MHRLMLLRHAKSSWDDPSLPDRERPLARRGRKAAPLVAACMVELELAPDLVLCSTAVRARETWDLIVRKLRIKPEVRYDDRLYDADEERILEVVRQAPAPVRSILVVGHNPGLEEFAERLVVTGSAETREAMRSKFPTAGLAVFALKIDAWEDLRLHSGRLEHFITPKMIEEEEKAS